VHLLVNHLPRHNWQTPLSDLPTDAIYFFLELGETVQVASQTVDRVVRVGTHRRDGRFRGRIRQHYGAVGSLTGNKNSSVFRKHVGGAVLRKRNPGDARLLEWLMQNAPTFTEVEQAVSQILHDIFTFACIQVDDAEERLSLERGLIGLLAQYPVGQPSCGWLGHHAAAQAVRASGLWNTQHVAAPPLTEREYCRLRMLAEAAIRRDH